MKSLFKRAKNIRKIDAKMALGQKSLQNIFRQFDGKLLRKQNFCQTRSRISVKSTLYIPKLNRKLPLLTKNVDLTEKL